MNKRFLRPRAARLALASTCILFPTVLPAQENHAGHEMNHEEHETTLAPVVVTAPAMDAPLEVEFDPRTPQQPVPPNDGAGILKTIPGMSVIRKGGSGGDPVFRGMAASRLNILLDGQQILGGCGGRMDPPTAYIFPDEYERVSLLKGPQSVLYGPGASAGTVRFERKPKYFATPGARVDAAFTVGSFDRYDGFLDVKGGNKLGYVEGILTHAHSSDYRDGNGDKVHSRYERESAAAFVGLTPDENTVLEFSAARSDAEAAYADRAMDGSKFRRENYGLKFEKSHIGGLVDKIEAQAYYNYIDHVMDNYSLRTPPMTPMASNPDRKTTGGRLAFTLLPADSLMLTVGVDRQDNVHTRRSGGSSAMPNYYRDQHRAEDMRFENTGLFGEARWQASAKGAVIVGARGDEWRAKDSRQPDRVSRRETLWSGFARYERDFSAGVAYVGLGRSERAPDFWELNKAAPSGGNDFKALDSEKTTQLDLGATLGSGSWQGFASVFYAKVDDFILIHSDYRGSGTTVARNVDATLWGGEAGATWRLVPTLKGTRSVAYVHGQNDSDHHALGQIPPLEGRLGLDWDNGKWSAGALWRLVAAQNRYARNEGNIVGQDMGKSGGFGVFSVNGGYRWSKTAQLSVGIDNLFDKTYAEHLSKSGADVSGYEQTMRVNEPGRSFWLRARFDF
ncbi:MAG: TonB-dependent copper receptor [Azoarcus sp.]|nr:TonB-dependent copper receptor [Azoarcus sp.]